MLTIISGTPRRGKSSLATHLGIQNALNAPKRHKMLEACAKLRREGFKVNNSEFALYSNYKIHYEDILYNFDSVIIDPEKIGRDLFIKPHSTLLITEAQTHFSTNMIGRLPPEQQRYFFESGHFGIDIIMDCPRGETIAPDIRRISHRFIYVLERKIFDKNGELITGDQTVDKYFLDKIEWKYEEYDKEQDFVDRRKPKIKKEVIDYNIFDCYDPFQNFTHFLPEKKDFTII